MNEAITDALRLNALNPVTWHIATRREFHEQEIPRKFRSTKEEYVKIGGSANSGPMHVMLARAAELTQDGEYFYIVDDAGTVIKPGESWIGYVVTIVFAGRVIPVELEMDIEKAKARANSWRKCGARLRAHTFCSDSYYPYTKLHSECCANRDKMEASYPD